MLLRRLVAASEREAWRARRLVNERRPLKHGGSRIGASAGAVIDPTCVLSLLEAPGPCPAVPEPWLPRFRWLSMRAESSFKNSNLAYKLSSSPSGGNRSTVAPWSPAPAVADQKLRRAVETHRST